MLYINSLQAPERRAPHELLHQGRDAAPGDGDGLDGGRNHVSVRDGYDVRAPVAAVYHCASQRASLQVVHSICRIVWFL